MVAYHDAVWGVPVHDDPTLFAFLTLEGAQAGLSWRTILLRTDGYGRAFAAWDIAAIAAFDAADRERLLNDTGIIRNRAKIGATIGNALAALAALAAQAEFGSLSALLWSFVGGRPLQNAWPSLDALPAETAESQAMSRTLKARGFRFVGPTICYALMQAVGMVNDHETGCPRYVALGGSPL